MAASSTPSWSTASLLSEVQQRPGYSQDSIETQIQTASRCVLVTPQPCEHTFDFGFVLDQFNRCVEALNATGKTIELPLQLPKETLEDSENPIHCFCGRSIHKILLVIHKHLEDLSSEPQNTPSHVIMDELAHRKAQGQLNQIQQLLDHFTNTKPMTPEKFRQSLTSLFEQTIPSHTMRRQPTVEEPLNEELEWDLEAQIPSNDEDESESIDPELENDPLDEPEIEHPCDRPLCFRRIVVLGRHYLWEVTPKMLLLGLAGLVTMVSVYALVWFALYLGMSSAV